MPIKNCKTCDKSFSRKPRFNLKWWANAKYCSNACSAKAKIGKPSGTLGKVAWNKGIPVKPGHFAKLMAGRMKYIESRKSIPKKYKPDPRNTRAFRDFRIEILIKSSYMCRECGVVNGRLEIDHIKPVKFYPELVFDEENVRVLCRECHKKTPTYGVKVFTYGSS